MKNRVYQVLSCLIIGVACVGFLSIFWRSYTKTADFKEQVLAGIPETERWIRTQTANLSELSKEEQIEYSNALSDLKRELKLILGKLNGLGI